MSQILQILTLTFLLTIAAPQAAQGPPERPSRTLPRRQPRRILYLSGYRTNPDGPIFRGRRLVWGGGSCHHHGKLLPEEQGHAGQLQDLPRYNPIHLRHPVQQPQKLIPRGHKSIPKILRWLRPPRHPFPAPGLQGRQTVL